MSRSPPASLRFCASEKRSHGAALGTLARLFDEDLQGANEPASNDAAAALKQAAVLDEAGALQRWANAGRLIASAAHELRGALTAAQVNLEYLAAELARPHSAAAEPEMAEAVKDARSGITRALESAEQVTALASARPAGVVALSARAAVDAAVAAIAPRLRGVLAIEIDDAGVVPVRAEPGALHQSLVNLLLNAADAASEERGRGRLRVSIAPRDGWVCLAVADNRPLSQAGLRGQGGQGGEPASRAVRGSALGLTLSAAALRAFAGALEGGEGGPLGGFEYAILLHPAGDAT